MGLTEITPQYVGKIVCSAEEYHAAAAIGSSGLRTIINRSPAHYLWDKEHPEESTPAQAFGTAIHQAILEPKRFHAMAVVEPTFSGTGSRAEREKWHIQNAGKTILKQEQYDAIQGILNAIRKNETAYRLVSEGHPEESLFWRDTETGLFCKSRPDFVREGHVVVDVKTCVDASYATFQKSIASYGYHIQASFYLEACSKVLDGNYDTFILLAIEKEPPFEIGIYQLNEATIREGRAQYQLALKLLKTCMDTGKYHGYNNGAIMPMELPSWAYQMERE
jgi:hypothetical protein